MEQRFSREYDSSTDSKEILLCHRNQRFITVPQEPATGPYCDPDQPTSCQTIYTASVLILSSDLHQGIPMVFCLQAFQQKTAHFEYPVSALNVPPISSFI
jgi:hypothetical protein